MMFGGAIGINDHNIVPTIAMRKYIQGIRGYDRPKRI
jgi:hypothetical protein